MSDLQHSKIPFDELHKARFDVGIADDLPAAPEGTGDAYYATDIGTLYLANTAADGWDAHALGNIASTPMYSGARVLLDTPQVIGALATATIQWTVEDIDIGDYVDLVANDTRLTVPAGLSGVFRFGFTTPNLGTSSYNLFFRLLKNGANVRQFDASSITSPVAVSETISLVAGDYLELEIVNNDNFSRAFSSATAYYHAAFELTYLGATA